MPIFFMLGKNNEAGEVYEIQAEYMHDGKK